MRYNIKKRKMPNIVDDKEGNRLKNTLVAHFSCLRP